MITAFTEYMKENGWIVRLNDVRDNHIPDIITGRYLNIPGQWLEFIRKFDCIMSPDETIWFLCVKDFEIQSDEAFQWNEWEKISLECAEGDSEWSGRIEKFWDNHLPIIMSVKDGYAYYAVSMKDGSVVKGDEPEFEGCKVVAVSFTDLIEKLIKGELRL